MNLGIHQSFSGLGNLVYDAKTLGANTFQFFIRNNRNLQSRTFLQEDFDYFNAALLNSGIMDYVLHASYAINPASGLESLREKSKNIIMSDLTHLSRMAGCAHYVLHPGAYTDYTELQCMNNLIALMHELSPIAGKTQICLETMGGQGTQLMSSLESIAYVMYGCRDLPNVGLCLDTCHLYVAGIPFSDIKKVLTKENLGVLHINGTLKEFRSRSDRHSSILDSNIPIRELKELIDTCLYTNPDTCFILETPGETLVQDYLTVRSWY